MQVLIELDEATLRRLENVAPAKSRKRSGFIRAAVQRALWELDEERTRQAYLADPDREPPAFDAAAWEALPYGGFDAPAPRQKPPAREKPRRSEKAVAGLRPEGRRRARKR